MPRGGSKPGERRGGRKKGSRNLKLVEKDLLAQRELADAKEKKRKLGKEVLDDFMHLFAGMAAYYQPAPPGAPPRPQQNEIKFKEYAALATTVAKDLAQYQSPKYSAVMVGQAGPQKITVVGGLPSLDQKGITIDAVGHAPDRGDAPDLSPRSGELLPGHGGDTVPGLARGPAVGKDRV